MAKCLGEYTIVRRDFLYDHERCYLCHRLTLLGRQHIHHVYGKLGKLRCWTPGFRLLCLRCHRWVDTHPTLAREAGLLGPPGTWNDYEAAVAHYEITKKKSLEQ